MDIFEKCPALENEKLLVRLIRDQDAEDLLQVYGDKFALPFFNSDNCHAAAFTAAAWRIWRTRSSTG